MKNYMFHRFMIKLTKIVAGPFLKNKMKYKCHISNDIDRPTLVLSNHTTNFDPLLVTLAFRKHMYFLASEHAFRAGFGSKVLRTVYSPIPFNKTKTDINAIKEVMHRLSAGANVCLFPEGDRSFSGTTVHSASSVVKLAKQCRVDVITFKLEGGYFTSPRWSTKMRKGKMSGAIVNKYLADEVAAMSEDELIGKINTDIYVDAYESQKENLVKYKGENLAENIEVSLYLCPSCKGIGYIKSKGDGFACRCGLSGRYTQAGYLEGPKLPFTKTTDWGKWQEETLGEVIKSIPDGPICMDVGQSMYEVHAGAYKVPAGEGTIQINRSSFKCCGHEFALDRITKFAVVGQMTLLFATKEGAMYEIRSRSPRSALKYRDIFKVLTGR